MSSLFQRNFQSSGNKGFAQEVKPFRQTPGNQIKDNNFIGKVQGRNNNHGNFPASKLKYYHKNTV